MITKVQKWGNSQGIRIPKSFAQEVEVEAGSEVNLTAEKGRLIINAVQPPRYALEDLLARITSRNRHGEIQTDPPVGREAW